jgi:hypothetical protein
MADRREMSTGIRKAAGASMLLALAAVLLAACGSGSDTTTSAPPAVSASTADHLAKLSNRIASDLDSGDTCHAAHAADDLHTAVQESDLPANLRPEVDTVAGDLVDQVNCPPPPPPPPPEPEKKPKKPKPPKPDEHGNGNQHGNGDEHGNGNGNGHDNGHGNSDLGGVVPPSQAQLGGE